MMGTFPFSPSTGILIAFPVAAAALTSFTVAGDTTGLLFIPLPYQSSPETVYRLAGGTLPFALPSPWRLLLPSAAVFSLPLSLQISINCMAK
jgi:hypothetical protein